ncbi:alpha-ketoglutarate dependent xanthine dioxygenase [Aspergillus crustosus]
MAIQPAASQVKVMPQKHTPESKVNFGAIITGSDLNNLDELTFQTIREAIYTHNVVIIKGQQDKLPINQFNFVQRLDSEAHIEHGWGTTKEAEETTGVTGKLKWYTIPGTPGVQLIGHGYQGDDHYGLQGITMKGVGHESYHTDALPKEDLERGDSRFVVFHYDGIVYGAHPSRVTTLRAVTVPSGPLLTIRWDDGTGRTMKAQPGGTAFYSNAQLYSLLTPEEKTLADHSYWEIAPYPCMWSGNRKHRSKGAGLNAGEGLSLDDLPPWSPEKVYKYPMVWINSVTGERGFQVRAEAIRKLYVKSSADAEERVVDDPEEIRTWLNDILDRIVALEYINIPPVEEGDVIAWNNWVTHQCHITSNTPPIGPLEAN